MSTPATETTPLRDRIVAHLKNTGEATAAAIAKAVGMADTPSRVNKELNAMRTDALIEAERKGKGPDLTYWLAGAQAPLPQAALPAHIRAGTRAAQIWQALPEHGQRPMLAREIVAAIGVKKELVAPVLTEMVKAKQAHRIDDGLEYAYTRMPAAGEDGERDEKATCKDHLPVALAAEEVATVRESPAVPEATDEAAEELAQIRALLADRVSGNIDPSDLSEVELADRAAAMIDDAVDEISELQLRVADQERQLQQQTELVAELRAQIAAPQAAQPDPVGYLMRATKRKPLTIRCPERARACALNAIRLGAQHAEVFALVPVGRALRNAEWEAA